MADDPAVQLAALKRARASGAMRVRHGDTSTSFRSLAEIDSIIASLETDAGIKRTRRRYPIQITKGL